MTVQLSSSFNHHQPVGTLYLVPTPIGNLADMSPRAVATLKKVDLICAEDTRNTARLLAHFEVGVPQISFHEHNTNHRLPQLIEKLKAGKNLAQVSDAGMPCISDPGALLVEACRKQNIPVVAIPGPNAALTALIASGLVPQPFYFHGFLDRKASVKQNQLQKLLPITATLIFYEAPHRLVATLVSMSQVFAKTRRVALCRELTKKYEQYITGTLEEVTDWAKSAQIRGEFVVLVSGATTDELAQVNQATENEQRQAQLPLKAAVDELINTGKKPNAAIKAVAKARKLSRQQVYNHYHNLDEGAKIDG